MLACVCRWSIGLSSAHSPAIHIFAGLKVCIQVMMPTTFGAALASRISCRIASRDVSTGFHTTRQATSSDRSSIVDDLLRLRRDLGQHLVAVQRLAAGEEPDLVLGEVRARCCDPSHDSFHRAPSGACP